MLKAVILIGGPQKGISFHHIGLFEQELNLDLNRICLQKGTRFRPLSLDLPKPLFPIAGRSIIQHHIEACIQLKELKEILVIGYYPVAQMEKFIAEMQNLYDVGIR